MDVPKTDLNDQREPVTVPMLKTPSTEPFAVTPRNPTLKISVLQ